MATLREIEKFLDTRIPRTLSLAGDPDGTALCTDYGRQVHTVVIGLDVTLELLEFAKANGAELVVTHHPSIYSPLSAITADSPVGKRMIAAIKADIALMSYHTRLDALEGGVNDRICELLGVTPAESFADGLGRVALLDRDYSYSEFCAKAGAVFGTDKVTGIDSGRSVRKIAILGGSGKGSFTSAVATGADTFLTGEVVHSTMLDAREQGINLVCATHYRTECPVMTVLGDIISKQYPSVKVLYFYDTQL